MKIYFKYLKILIKKELQYRTSFILLAVGQFFVPFIIFVGIYLLFLRFPNVGGWSLYEVALTYAIIHIAFSISECFGRGFDVFSTNIKSGTFDRILLRPRSTILQVFGTRFEFSRIGRLLQAIIVLIYAIYHLNIDWSIMKTITLMFMIISGIIIFIGIFMIGATFAFWTIEGLEVINIFSDGGRAMAQYPLTIYNKFIRKFFTFVIPLGTVNYLPLMFVLDKVNENKFIYMLTPLLGILFIIPCITIWNHGVKHYKSTGS